MRACASSCPEGPPPTPVSIPKSLQGSVDFFSRGDWAPDSGICASSVVTPTMSKAGAASRPCDRPSRSARAGLAQPLCPQVTVLRIRIPPAGVEGALRKWAWWLCSAP